MLNVLFFVKTGGTKEIYRSNGPERGIRGAVGGMGAGNVYGWKTI